ncbi:MAG: NAD(P)H-dependent glycerol-3-phosphate dehydrogenase [Lentimicrobiaceae bacterium]|jgi:glycerol-3-phosphate dehydrogenase (NAD(P)+)
MRKMQNIVFLGGGSIGTALGNSLAVRSDLNVSLLSIEHDVVETITKSHINQKYFPNIRLNQALKATSDPNILKNADVIFIGIPSVAVVDYMQEIRLLLPENAILVNLAKGFGCHNQIISQCLAEHHPNPVCALKGPSFAREIVNNSPTAFTLASTDIELCNLLEPLFEETNIFVDTTTDLLGVEIISILKNIYAILMGIVDAHFNSPNLRFMMFTRAFSEMRKILKHFGGQEETMFHYCGIGDFGLTALNDLSRNRTLGLLIGKGFFNEGISNKVVLEGRIAMSIILKKLIESNMPETGYHMMHQLDKVFAGDTDIPKFMNKMINERY